MQIPFEETVNVAIEKAADVIIAKINLNEEKRNREFTYQLKELEFYKSNYQKDLKLIFDYWFELIRISYTKDNPHLTAAEREKYKKRYAELSHFDKMSLNRMNTIKYGGKETGRVLALENKLHHKNYEKQPQYTGLFIWCSILSVLKMDILGQNIMPDDIIQIIVNDFDDHATELEEAKKYVRDLYFMQYNEYPYWIILRKFNRP